MQRFLGAVVILVILVGALGFYRGWFSFTKTNEDHNTNMTITVNKDKINEDKENAEHKLKDIGKTLKEDLTPGKVKDESAKH